MKKIIFFLIIFLISSCDHSKDTLMEKSELPSSISLMSSSPITEEVSIFKEQVKAVPLYRMNPQSFLIEPIGDAPASVLLLTFDDIPLQNTTETLQKIVDILLEKKLRAIFFVNGYLLDTEEEREMIKELHELGFVIGNHSFSHKRLDKLSFSEAKEDILKNSELIESLTGDRPVYFRPPFGVINSELKAFLSEESMIMMNWSYGYDWQREYHDPKALIDIMIESPYLQNGANLLLHEHPWTAEALEGIIEGLQGKGYTFVDPKDIDVMENDDE